MEKRRRKRGLRFQRRKHRENMRGRTFRASGILVDGRKLPVWVGAWPWGFRLRVYYSHTEYQMTLAEGAAVLLRYARAKAAALRHARDEERRRREMAPRLAPKR
jgi:hypothetical protein